MSFFVVEKNLKTIHEVCKYIKDGDGIESVWSNTWTGRHVIGQDCFWCKTDTVLEKIWKETKSIAGFKVMSENVGVPLPEILLFINLKKKRLGQTTPQIFD